MIDFHSHILPGIDDGSKSPEMSIEMLSMYPKELTGVCLTPHFYPSEDKPENFLERRAKAYDKLIDATKDLAHPTFYLGCEMHYFQGISHFKGIEAFKFEGTRLIMIEMPMRHWTINMMEELIALKSNFDLQPVLAHIDRYKFAKGDNKEAFNYFVKKGGLVQMNFEAFTAGFFSRQTALKFLRNGTVQFLGTDAHNIGSRKPDMEDGLSKLSSKIRKEVINIVSENEKKLIV